FKIADRVTVLKDGENKGTWPIGAAGTADPERGAGAAITNAQLIEVMAGRALLQSVAHSGPRAAEPVLAVRGLTHRGMYQDVSFELRPGEISVITVRQVLPEVRLQGKLLPQLFLYSDGPAISLFGLAVLVQGATDLPQAEIGQGCLPTNGRIAA